MKMATSVVNLLLMVVLSACAFFPSISFGCQLKSDVEQAKLKFSRLESLINDTILDLNAKSLYLNESRTHIEEMEFELERLQIEMSILKGGSSHTHLRVHQLEEEVQLLWNNLRKSNFKTRLLEAKAQEADNRLESVTSQVEMMAAIVTEQWLQIQQLEQALHTAQMRASKAKRERMFKRCSFLKWVGYLFEENSAIGFYLSRGLDHLLEIFTAAKRCHHELQGFIKHEMERNEYTATLANDEVVFFLASAVCTFPIMGAWMCLVSQFN